MLNAVLRGVGSRGREEGGSGSSSSSAPGPGVPVGLLGELGCSSSKRRCRLRVQTSARCPPDLLAPKRTGRSQRAELKTRRPRWGGAVARPECELAWRALPPQAPLGVLLLKAQAERRRTVLWNHIKLCLRSDGQGARHRLWHPAVFPPRCFSSSVSLGWEGYERLRKECCAFSAGPAENVH